MKDISNQWIKLKEDLNFDDYIEIQKLSNTCTAQDKTTLKLELDYKLNTPMGKTGPIKIVNEFFYYDGSDLIGYLGICNFGGSPLEINGMVHPEYRRKGVFTKLFHLAKEEWKKRDIHLMFLLSDRASDSGQAFIKTTGSTYENSEYEMYLNMNDVSKGNKELSQDVVLRKATNEDAKEVSFQNSIYSHSDYDEANLIMPEEEEIRNFTIYLAVAEGVIVGKVHLQRENDQGGIYGLGVLPEHRSKGYGRKILLKAIEILIEEKLERIMLQVATHNSNALNLYKSCGFEETSIMDYYQLSQ